MHFWSKSAKTCASEQGKVLFWRAHKINVASGGTTLDKSNDITQVAWSSPSEMLHPTLLELNIGEVCCILYNWILYKIFYSEVSCSLHTWSLYTIFYIKLSCNLKTWSIMYSTFKYPVIQYTLKFSEIRFKVLLLVSTKQFRK